MLHDNVFIMMGVSACLVAIGLMLAVILRDKRKKPPVNFNVEPPF